MAISIDQVPPEVYSLASGRGMSSDEITRLWRTENPELGHKKPMDVWYSGGAPAQEQVRTVIRFARIAGVA